MEEENKETKICKICKKEKLLLDFYHNHNNISGYDNKCKECFKDYTRINYRKKYPKKIKILSKEGYKICTKCKKEKPLLEFSKSKNAKDNYQFQCKICSNYLNTKYVLKVIPKERYKFCFKCKEEKLLSEFHKCSNNKKNKVTSWCKDCTNIIGRQNTIEKHKNDYKPPIGYKICNNCKIEKQLSEFHNNKQTKDKLNTQCKMCACEEKKLIYENNKELYREQRKNFSKEEKEKRKQNWENWYKDNPNYREEWIEKNKEKYEKRKKNYYILNKKRHLENNKKRSRERKKKDPLFKLRCNLGSKMSIIFKKNNWIKGNKTEKLLGCAFEEAKIYIENKFVEGMTWENHGSNKGQWEIDHIIPLSSAKTEEELRKLFHYTNLQPLWEHENGEKSAKLNWIRKCGI